MLRLLRTATILVLLGAALPAAAQITPPYSQTFESEGECGTSCVAACTLLSPGWQNVTGDGTDWLAHAGSTPSTNTGPDVDHTTGTAAGKYLYVESSGCNLATSNLLSPVFDLSAAVTPAASFWYHMYGATMGTLHVDVSTDGGATFPSLDVIPAVTGNENAWRPVGVDLSAWAGQAAVVLRIRGVTGTSFTSDIAIDDFALCDSSATAADVGVTATIPPPAACGLSATQPIAVVITNFGACAASPASFDVAYSIDGGPWVTETYTGGPIAAGASKTHTFTATADFSGPGPFTMDATTLLAGDANPANDNLHEIITRVGERIASFPALEDFESVAGRWFTAALSSSGTSWAFGTPAKPVINRAASGANAWVTGGLAGSYGNNESSAVQSRCGYDLSSLTAPAVSLAVWWQCEFSWDGAQLQSSIDGGQTWQTVGAFGDPNHWYTDNTIIGLPDQIGWSGRNSTGNGSGGWVTAVHDLAGLAGQPSVLLRVRFGTDASVVDEGFAFDDVDLFENLGGVSVATMGPPASPAGVAAGTTDQLTHTLLLRATGGAAEAVDALTVTRHGNATDGDVPAASLWLDDGNGVRDAGDTLLVTQPFVGGVAALDTTGLVALAPFIRTTVFVTAEVSATAAPGALFGTEIASATHVVVPSGAQVRLESSPCTGPLFTVFGRATVPYFEDFALGTVANLARVAEAGLTYPQAAATGAVPTQSAATANAAAVLAGGSVALAGGGTVDPSTLPYMMTVAFPRGAATGAFDLYFDLSGKSVAADDLWLGFSWNQAHEEDHLEDNVFVSTDGGATWATSLFNFDFTTPAPPAWQGVLLDLSAALAAVGADYTGDVVVRFQAAGDGALGVDGLLVDDLFVGRAMVLGVERPSGTPLLDGGSDTLGNVLLGARSLTYTITNHGDLPLDVTPTSFATTNAVNVASVVVTPPAVNPVPAHGTTTFQVDFSVPAVGAFGFDLRFDADDPRLADGQFNLAVAGTGTAPEIDAQRPAGTSIASGTADAQAGVRVGATQALTYTLANLGTADLHLSGTPLVAVANQTNVTASLTTPPAAALLAPSATTTFVVGYTVAATGAFSFDLIVASDDADENPYTITVSGTGVTPEIEVQRPAGTAIAAGGTDAQGTPLVGAAQALTYTLANLGTADLHLSGTPLVAVANQTNVTASLTTPPAALLAPSATTTFVVGYTVTAAGAFSFDLTIASDDLDEGTYTVTVSGTGVTPEIEVQRPAGTAIAAGGTDAQGTPLVGAAQALTYTVANLGTADLHLSGTPLVAIANPTNVTASLTTPPAALLAASATTTFVVGYTVTAVGAFSFDLTITSDDLDEGTYTVTVSGSGVTPEIDVQRPAGTAIPADGTDAQGTPLVGAAQALTYTITNPGTADLHLSGTPLVAVANPTNVTASLTTPPTALLAPSATTTFVVGYTVTAAGAFSFDLTITSDDADESPYTVTVSGTGRAQDDGGVPDSGTPDSGTPDSGTPVPPDGGTPVPPDGGGSDAGAVEEPGSGCGCRTATDLDPSPVALLALGLAALTLTRRRKSRR